MSTVSVMLGFKSARPFFFFFLMPSWCLHTPLHLLPFYITFFQPPLSPTMAFILTFKGTQSTAGLLLLLWQSYGGNLNPKQRLVIKISPAESSGVQTCTLASLLTHDGDQPIGMQQRDALIQKPEDSR